MKKVIITGANSFSGSAVVNKLSKVIIVDRNDNYFVENLG